MGATIWTLRGTVKIRLAGKVAHAAFKAIVGVPVQKTLRQRNYFFDGSGNELSAARTAFRLRFIGPQDNEDECVLTVKKRGVMMDGISRAEEVCILLLLLLLLLFFACIVVLHRVLRVFAFCECVRMCWFAAIRRVVRR